MLFDRISPARASRELVAPNIWMILPLALLLAHRVAPARSRAVVGAHTRSLRPASAQSPRLLDFYFCVLTRRARCTRARLCQSSPLRRARCSIVPAALHHRQRARRTQFAMSFFCSPAALRRKWSGNNRAAMLAVSRRGGFGMKRITAFAAHQ